MAEAGRSSAGFGPIVLAGLGGGLLAAVASARRWIDVAGAVSEASGDMSTAYVSPWATAAEVPLASAVSLVVLASWGVLLVTRGRVRRLVAGLTTAAAAVLGAVVVWARWTLPDKVLEAARGEFGSIAESSASDLSWTGWWWLALLGALVCAGAGVLAVTRVPRWPEMGRKYDAPGTDGPQAPVADPADPERTSIDLWKAIDEGRDPTE